MHPVDAFTKFFYPKLAKSSLEFHGGLTDLGLMYLLLKVK